MTHEDYTVAWICALPLEAAAAKAMLDKTHSQLSQSTGDDNAYTLGEISGHNIVIACLPSGVYGIASAATVAANIRTTFASVRFGLMVGIGGGVPSTNNDIRLGDVVVSKPTGVLGGVVQYDYGKTVAGGVFQQTGMMNQPPQVLLNAIARLHADEILGNNQSIVEAISNVRTKSRSPLSRPADEHDRLFNPAYDHPPSEDTCINCDKRQLIHRLPRTSDEPEIHYGLIASGNQVMKHGETPAGLMNQLPCLVIRGICDYSDSHKNKHWQGYAAFTAAAYARILLSQLRKSFDQASQEGCWMVPFGRNPRFLGRHNEVVGLQERIVSKDQQHVGKMAITGLGGVGKTQIALEIAYRIRDKKPEFSIFWMPATSVEKIEQAYIGIGERLGLQGVTPTDMKKAVKAHLSSEKTGPWLLIIDNLDDMNIWTTSDASSPALKTYIPQSKYGFVLFTTRNQQLATSLVGPEVISIHEMDDKMAADLLRASLIHKDLVNDSQTTTQLLRQLSCLPLAIIQAASYMNQTGISVATYLSLLERQENEMVELLSQDFEDEWRYSESKNPVARLNSLAADYLSFMSCIDPRDIPLSLGNGHEAVVKLLLDNNAVIESTDEYGRTPLLWAARNGHEAVVKLLLDKNADIQSKGNDGQTPLSWAAENGHEAVVKVLLDMNADVDIESKNNSSKTPQGRWMEAEKLGVQVMETFKTVLGPEHPDTLTSMSNLASTYRYRGQWMEAEKLEVQVHPNTLTSMHNLASTYRNQGRWMEAEKLFVQVMETEKTVLGPEHPDTLMSMWKLSRTLKGMGRCAEALSLLRDCVQLQEQRLGPTHPYTISATAHLKAWQEEHSTHSTGRRLKYISRTISTVRGAIKFRKE
ncbi:purine and uridine phosphorylase [Elaphomyces granulatus]